MEHIVRILDIVIWPAVVITALIMFKGALRTLLGRIRSFESSNNKIEFDTQVEQLERINVNSDILLPEESEESKTWKETLLQIAKLRPRAAIIEAWTSIELACIEAGMQRGTVGPSRFYPQMLEEFLSKTEGFDRSMIQQIMEMRKLRNLVIHGRDQEFGFLDSEKYIDLADKVLTAIKAQQSA